MSDEGIMQNYEGILDNLRRVIKLENQILVLDARVLKLEEIIVELANVEPDNEPFSIEDMAEIALENRMNEDRGEDR